MSRELWLDASSTISACSKQVAEYPDPLYLRDHIHVIPSRKEYRLSFPARILSSRYQSWIHDGVLIDRKIDLLNIFDEIVRN